MKLTSRSAARRRQHGGFFIGLVVGLLIGLAAALAVALYVTKAPNPFVNKVPGRSAVQDAAEAEKNRSWDPNSALAGRNPAPSGTASPPPGLAPPPPPALVAPIVIDPLPAPAASAPTRTARASAPATGATSTGGAVSGADPFSYFVQAGAFARSEDAEQQRAKLALLGVESRLTEREQAGRSVYRVRVGPFERKEEADAAKDKLGDAGVDSALVRVQK